MKLNKICALTLTISCLFGTVSFANPWPEFITAGSQGGGWRIIDGQYKTYEIMDDTTNYKPIANHFLWEYGTLYHFDVYGHMTTNSWVQDSSGNWYYFGSDGRAITDQWIGGTYYVGSNGMMYHGEYTPDGYWVGADGRWDGNPSKYSTQNNASQQVATTSQKQALGSSGLMTINTSSGSFNVINGLDFYTMEIPGHYSIVSGLNITNNTGSTIRLYSPAARVDNLDDTSYNIILLDDNAYHIYYMDIPTGTSLKFVGFGTLDDSYQWFDTTSVFHFLMKYNGQIYYAGVGASIYSLTPKQQEGQAILNEYGLN